MKLTRARVRNYRSVVDSGEVEIDENVTVLIGKNEQGKTTFLRGLFSTNKNQKYFARDFPNHLRPKLEEVPPAEIPMVTLWLASEPSDRPQLESALTKAHAAGPFKVTRYFDGHYTYETVAGGTSKVLEVSPADTGSLVASLKTEVDGLQARLASHTKRTEAFAPALDQFIKHATALKSATFSSATDIQNVLQTFAVAVSSLPGQDPPIQEEIAGAMKKIEAVQADIVKVLTADRLGAFADLIPTFVIHSSTVDRIPDEVTVADFVANPDGWKGMANLCKIAGLSFQKIQELANSTDVAHRETYEDHYSHSISGGINEFWTQAEYNVHFRLDREKLSVSISDDSYSPRIPPSQRSDGFQWYLSFYSTLLGESSAAGALVLLLDNPGLELHPDGQKDVKRFLEEKLPRSAQVIYVTHSPAMIDPFNLEQVRLVKRGDDEGTSVGGWAFSSETDADLLEPVRSAIGASLVTSLMFSDYNVLVEGAADKPIMEGAFALRSPADMKRIQLNGPVSETPGGFLPLFYQRAGLPFVVFLDGDDSGRKLAKNLEGWGISAERVLTLNSVFPDKGRDFELEDVVDGEFYDIAVRETYPDKLVDKPTGPNKKRTKLYEEAYRAKYDIGFSKKRVGETIKRLLMGKRADTKTQEELGKITAAILGHLEK